MKIKNTVMTLLAASLFWTASFSLAQAEYNITPNITIREEYNDNIYLTSSGEIDDFITTVTPGVSLSYKRDFLTLTMNYGLAFLFYAKHSDLDQTSLTQTQQANIDTTFTPYRDILFVKLTDVYQRVPIDQRNQVALGNPFVNLTDTNDFHINPYLVYPLTGTLMWNLGYTYENLWYRSDEGNNAETHTVTTGLTKAFSSKLSASIMYSYLFFLPTSTGTLSTPGPYITTEAYDQQTVNLATTYKISQKFSLSGSVGETITDYSVSKDFNSTSPVYQFQANYQLTNKLALGAGYLENFVNSIDDGQYKNRSITGTLSYGTGKIPPVAISVFESDAKYTTVDREDKAIGGTIGTSLPLTSKLQANFSGTYTNFKFLPDTERVNRYGAMIGFAYKMKITTISGGYIWNKNHSNIATNDYANNDVYVQATFTY